MNKPMIALAPAPVKVPRARRPRRFNRHPHELAVTELVVRRGGEVIRRLRACPGGYREVES